MFTLSLFGSTAAFADTAPGASGTIHGASSIVYGGTFTGLGSADIASLSATNQTDKEVGTLGVDVTDLTGKGTGWTVSASAPLFKLDADNSKTLPTKISPDGTGTAALTPINNSSSTGVTSPLITATSLASSTSLMAATLGNGMGSYTLTDAILVDVPANSYSGSYSSTVTLTEAPAA